MQLLNVCFRYYGPVGVFSDQLAASARFSVGSGCAAHGTSQGPVGEGPEKTSGHAGAGAGAAAGAGGHSRVAAEGVAAFERVFGDAQFRGCRYWT